VPLRAVRVGADPGARLAAGDGGAAAGLQIGQF
jgi:hypothetical protein